MLNHLAWHPFYETEANGINISDFRFITSLGEERAGFSRNFVVLFKGVTLPIGA